jgi:hypothetical protein
MQKLESLSAQSERTFRIVINEGLVDIYSNGTLVASQVDLTTLTTSDSPSRVQFGTASTATYTGYIYYARAKIGRID